jgi:hypothetical protein
LDSVDTTLYLDFPLELKQTLPANLDAAQESTT